MREIGHSGSSVGHRDCECRVGPEGNGERGREEAGVEELSSGLSATELPLLPLLPLLEKRAAVTGGRRGEDEQCLSVKL